MDHSQEAAPLQKRPRHIRRWIILAVVLALAGWFGRFAYLRITLRPTPRPEYWQAKLAALNPVPADALTIAEVDKLFADRPWEGNAGPGSAGWRYDLGPADDASGSLYTDASASREFQKGEFQKARAAVIQAMEKGWRSDLLVGPWTYGFNTGGFQWAAALIRHAQWSREWSMDGKGNGAGLSGLSAAREDWLAVLRMGRQLQRERRAAFTHIWAAIEERLADDLMRAARSGVTDIDARALASEVDASRVKVDRPGQYFEGDRLALHAQLEQVYVREGGNWIDVSTMVAGQWAGWWAAGTQVPSRIWNLTSPVFHTLEEARAYVDGLFASLDHPGTYAPPQGMNMSYGINWYYFWQTEDALRRIQKSHALMDAALAVLALRTYHDRNGRYPERLEELVPDYLPKLPVQYHDNTPLAYRRTAQGYEIRGVARPMYEQYQRANSGEPPRGETVLTPEGFQEVQP